ncbi:hypothetical protein EMPS_09765 [Entomortierella parvispora]|uniref:Uncharacterized protein n=1 Tax=Entomortierella parvispora TaxID=205924 RepID=A0A9P3HIT4_9FUNG|nr:hypothetical protein EMPS_09765 [Entomortierella parvispora]
MSDDHLDLLERLKNGKVPWISVPFPQDSEWTSDTAYGPHLKEYYSLYAKDMPKVPGLMTHCTVSQYQDGGPHYHRVDWHSMVLKPKRWIITRDHNGLAPIAGSDSEGSVTIERTEETTMEIKYGIQFDSSVAISGGEGPLKGSSDLKVNAGKHWTKKITLIYKRSEITAQGFSYQPTRIYAQLLCEVIFAREGSFVVNGYYEKELITTNTPGVKAEYQSKSYQMDNLYNAFGKDVVAKGFEWGDMWQKASLARLKLVVDPHTAKLNVTGSAHRANKKGITLSSSYWEVPQLLDDYYRRLTSNSELESFSANYLEGIYSDMGKLDNYQVLCGVESGREDEAITYSPGNLVKVWMVTVRGDRS